MLGGQSQSLFDYLYPIISSPSHNGDGVGDENGINSVVSEAPRGLWGLHCVCHALDLVGNFYFCKIE